MIHIGVAQYLGSMIHGLSYSEVADTGNVFVDGLPADPDRAVGVYITAGPEADSLLPYDPVAFQIVTRCESGTLWALTMWASIYSLLHGKRNMTLPDGTQVVYLLVTHASPVRLGEDADGRSQYSLDVRGEIINPTAERPDIGLPAPVTSGS